MKGPTNGQINGIEWRISEDRLEVLCRATESYAKGAAPDQFQAALAEAGIKAQVDPNALESLLSEGTTEWVPVARGTPATPPVPPRLEYYVDPFHIVRTGAVSQDGRMDYKRLNLVLNVKKGQELVRRHDGTPGAPGVDVTGEPIEPPAVPTLSIPAGEGIEIVENGYLAVAAADGALTTRGNGIAIMHLYTVSSDVAYKTGNIEFNGTVDVGKSVLSGFSVKSEGDIIVRGMVEAAELEAGGSITIFGGIQGGGRAVLRAKGGITAKFICDATVIAGDGVTVNSQIVNSNVEAGGAVLVAGGGGTIVGGEIRAGEKVSTTFLGSQIGVKTLVQIGLDSDLLRKIQHAEPELATLEARAEDLETLLKRLDKVREQRKNLTPAQEVIRIKAIKEKFLLKGHIETLSKSVQAMREELAKARKGTVEATDTVFGGVTIRIGGDIYPVGHDLRHTTFYYEQGEIRTRTN